MTKFLNKIISTNFHLSELGTLTVALQHAVILGTQHRCMLNICIYKENKNKETPEPAIIYSDHEYGCQTC